MKSACFNVIWINNRLVIITTFFFRWREVKSKESQRSRALANSKRAPTPPLSSSEEDSASDNDYDDIKLRQTKPASKSAKPAASRNPISPASSSASRPNHKKINGGGRINTDTKTYNSLLADELDVRQDFISTKNEKVEFYLDLHVAFSFLIATCDISLGAKWLSLQTALFVLCPIWQLAHECHSYEYLVIWSILLACLNIFTCPYKE